ncbi:MAG TPA: cation:proton antiporter [Armatimonadota bacterium]|nr:cation:proton antiporter [Armatimonadota bacterium]HPP73639.1 cation:proton antiporter [Armatimonadota bacterium]
MHGAETQTLLFLALILIAARIGGEIAIRLKQPAVLGEIIAGVLLGTIPQIRPAIESDAILFIAEIGVILLLFEVGLDSEFDEFLRVGLPSTFVAVIGVALPLIAGFGAVRLLGYSSDVALFLGGTLTATSIGITARVLNDLNQAQSQEATIIIGAAVADDILGLLVLSVLSGIASGHAVTPASVVGSLAISISFLVIAIVVGIKAAPSLIALTRRMQGRGVLAVAAFIFVIFLAYMSSLLGLAAIIGAFAAGLALASTDDKVKISEGIQPVANIFAPVFFATVGMQVDLTLLNPFVRSSWPFLGLALLLLLISVPTKVVAGLGAVRRDVDKLAVGIGMVPRGEVGLIFAEIGRRIGILNEGIYGAIVLVALITTLITPPWLKYRLSQRRQVT